MESLHPDREVLSARVLDAPRERVFRAWTESGLLKRWWGPRGFTNTFHVHEPRTGGLWRFVMHGPDGTDYKNKTEYLEVTAPERIVMRHASGPFYTATVTFEEAPGGKTRVTWHMLFDSAEVFQKIKHIVVPGNEDNLDRLEGVLKESE